MQKKIVSYQILPTCIHCANLAKRLSGVFKDYFVAGLVSVDPDFPIHMWCCRMLYTVTTYNLLYPLCLNLYVSPKAQLNGAFN